MKWVFWIWTVIVAGITLFVATATTKDESFSGTNVTLTTNNSHNVVINGNSSLLEAASSGFFLLRKESGESIVGVPTEKPLGWSSNKYYRAESKNDVAGEWIVQDGEKITIHVVGDQPVTVEKKWKDDSKFFLIFVEVVNAILVYLLGIWIGSSIYLD